MDQFGIDLKFSIKDPIIKCINIDCPLEEWKIDIFTLRKLNDIGRFFSVSHNIRHSVSIVIHGLARHEIEDVFCPVKIQTRTPPYGTIC